jgi:hypothetical protein
MDRAARHRGRRCALALLLPVLAAAQTLVLEIRAIEGEGAVQPAGARVLAPLSVVVTDETGRPVEGAAVTFRLPEEGAGGVFPNGLKTEVMRTGPDGRATVREIRWNRAPGPVRIRVTAVKDQARAGAIVNQYIAPGAPRAAGSGAAVLRGRRRWLKLAVLAGGAAAVGFTAGYAGRSSPRSAAEAAPPVKIGTPVIVIGRP